MATLIICEATTTEILIPFDFAQGRLLRFFASVGTSNIFRLGPEGCLVEGYLEYYNNVRLNSAIGYITPKDMLAGHQQEIQAERDGGLMDETDCSR
jgi:hypothetical protein